MPSTESKMSLFSTTHWVGSIEIYKCLLQRIGVPPVVQIAEIIFAELARFTPPVCCLSHFFSICQNYPACLLGLWGGTDAYAWLKSFSASEGRGATWGRGHADWFSLEWEWGRRFVGREMGIIAAWSLCVGEDGGCHAEEGGWTPGCSFIILWWFVTQRQAWGGWMWCGNINIDKPVTGWREPPCRVRSAGYKIDSLAAAATTKNNLAAFHLLLPALLQRHSLFIH